MGLVTGGEAPFQVAATQAVDLDVMGCRGCKQLKRPESSGIGVFFAGEGFIAMTAWSFAMKRKPSMCEAR